MGHVEKVLKKKSFATNKALQIAETVVNHEDSLFMALENSVNDVDNHEWLLDSGISNHVTPTEAIFVNLDKYYQLKLEGFEVKDEPDKVYKLHKALYGLKQAPQSWYKLIDAYLISKGFTKSKNEATLYTLKSKSQSPLFVSLYVDDLIIIGGDDITLQLFKKQMQSEFEMSDLGLMSFFLGLEIKQSTLGLLLSQ
ncbi:Uncharacterized protein TCM_020726 [Theobroma cacao]|uniref:Reverse transcriptase Ty1/copia-type domain-containing protein n=1 Tax=Theobroma cacao TaxID=3641 RepID=A0A061ELB9_THECC|nr:Uncharacterized protein TCM_020726 [Theobroma cacao]